MEQKRQQRQQFSKAKTLFEEKWRETRKESIGYANGQSSGWVCVCVCVCVESLSRVSPRVSSSSAAAADEGALKGNLWQAHTYTYTEWSSLLRTTCSNYPVTEKRGGRGRGNRNRSRIEDSNCRMGKLTGWLAGWQCTSSSTSALAPPTSRYTSANWRQTKGPALAAATQLHFPLGFSLSLHLGTLTNNVKVPLLLLPLLLMLSRLWNAVSKHYSFISLSYLFAQANFRPGSATSVAAAAAAANCRGQSFA